MLITAIVKLHEEDKHQEIGIRWIDLDEQGSPVRVCGKTGRQYEEFELIIEEGGGE